MPTPVYVKLDGHLTAAALDHALGRASVELGTERRPLVVDCTTMGSYDLDARSAFVSWNRANSPRVSGVAIITTNPLHRIVIATMRLASRQVMNAFSTRGEAEAWVAALRD